MRYLFVLFLAVSLLPAQLRISYDFSAAPAQLSVLTMNDLGFQEALGRFLNGPAAPDLTPILPVVLFVRNIGSRRIGFLNVRYTYTAADGDHPVDILHARNPIMGDQFEPGQEYLIYPGVGTIGHRTTGANPRMIAQTAAAVAQSSRIRVSIDAVTWDDGAIAGPDLGGIGRRYQAERAAIADAYAMTIGARESAAVRGELLTEHYTHTRDRVVNYANGRGDVLRGILDRFAPLKGGNQQ
jgi:hypothetical protein